MNDGPQLPAAWRIRPDDALRRRDRGRYLIGGSPLTVLRLNVAGARELDRLFVGDAIGTGDATQRLVRRMLERGMVHPDFASDGVAATPPHARRLAEVTVVIPVKDDSAGLVETLSPLSNDHPIVVVDDGSMTPVPAPVNRRCTMVRSPAPEGPGSARNKGAAVVTTPLIAFVDAGVVVDTPTLDALCTHFDDPDVVAVAPRIRSTGSAGPLGRFDRIDSPIDLGDRPSPVRPGATVPYVPTACLVVRRDRFLELGGFDAGLRFGEDVDLVWRLGATGSVRYDPSLEATHPPRRTLGGFVRQRFGYGSAAGPLASRHGPAVAPLRTSGWTLAILGLTLSGHPWLAVVGHGVITRLLIPRLGPLPDSGLEALRFTTKGNVWAIRTASRSALRSWWPITALAFAFPPTRPAARRALVGYGIERSVSRGRAPVVSHLLGVLDDVAYGAGVWWGAWRQRSLRALLPVVANGDISPCRTG